MKKQIDKNLEQCLINLAKKYKLDLLILFGSRAKGIAKSNSDYDLAFYSKKNFTLNRKEKLEHDITEVLAYKKFDLIEINELTNPILLFNIFQNGICLFKSNEKDFERIKENSYFYYIDSKNLLGDLKEKYLAAKI